MKFLPVLLATGALGSLVERQASVVLSAIQSISDATSSLNDGITSFSGAGDAQNLQSLSEAVVSAINQGNSDVSGISQLELSDALQLQGPTQDLADLVETTVNNAISKKGDFTSAGVAGTVLEQLQNQQSAATTFSSTVVSKVPEGAQSIAQGLVQPILDSLQKGVDAFQGSNNGPGSSSEGGSTPTSTGSGSQPTASGPVTTGGSTPTPTGGATATPPVVSPPPFTGAAAMPTAAAGYGAAAMVALVAAAAL